MVNLNEILKDCINGQRDAQFKLYSLLAPKMLAICRRYCKQIDQANDAMQIGFIKIFKTIHKFNHKSKLETWMTRIMINTAIDQFKKDLKYSELMDYRLDKLENDSNYLIEVEEDLSSAQKTKIRSCIENLPQGYKTIFNLYVIENYTHKEIGEMLNISSGTSKSQLARAKKMLKKELSISLFGNKTSE